MEPRIIFEDEWLTAVDKPAGMTVNESKTTSSRLTVQRWHGERVGIFDKRLTKNDEFLQKSGLVHRLDKDTSGVLVLAKTPGVYAGLKKQFLMREVKKTYVTLVHGLIDPESGVVSLPVGRHPRVWGKFSIGTDLSRTAVTEYERTEVFERPELLSLLLVQPLTGRSHQIRVHLQHLGHPVVSDPLYVGRKRLKSDRQWCPRMFLHATSLEISHPVTSERLVLKAELPPELQSVIKHCRQ